MSRSLRKTTIYGVTTCESEKVDKKIWHRRWRSKEHARLACATMEALESHLTLLEDQVSSSWDMGKDGRRYWPIKSQQQYAKHYAEKHCQNRVEEDALEQRILHRIAAK